METLITECFDFCLRSFFFFLIRFEISRTCSIVWLEPSQEEQLVCTLSPYIAVELNKVCFCRTAKMAGLLALEDTQPMAHTTWEQLWTVPGSDMVFLQFCLSPWYAAPTDFRILLLPGREVSCPIWLAVDKLALPASREFSVLVCCSISWRFVSPRWWEEAALWGTQGYLPQGLAKWPWANHHFL